MGGGRQTHVRPLTVAAVIRRSGFENNQSKGSGKVLRPVTSFYFRGLARQVLRIYLAEDWF
jgi:hypothetical protein